MQRWGNTWWAISAASLLTKKKLFLSFQLPRLMLLITQKTAAKVLLWNFVSFFLYYFGGFFRLFSPFSLSTIFCFAFAFIFAFWCCHSLTHFIWSRGYCSLLWQLIGGGSHFSHSGHQEFIFYWIVAPIFLPFLIPFDRFFPFICLLSWKTSRF